MTPETFEWSLWWGCTPGFAVGSPRAVCFEACRGMSEIWDPDEWPDFVLPALDAIEAFARAVPR